MPTVRPSELRRRRPSASKTYDPDALSDFFSWCAVGSVQSDGELRVYCPMCEDPTTSRTASASINATEGKWNCLKSSGDDPHGGSIEELLMWLKTERGMNSTVGATRKPAPKSRAKKSKLPPEIDHEDKATGDWPAMLRSTRYESRLAYLTAERGLSRKTLDKFQAGYDGQRFTVPIRSVDGVIRNVKKYKRGARDGEAKWISTKGHGTPSMVAFTSELAENTHTVIFCAGEFDAMLTNQALGGHAVAVTATGGEGIVPPDLSPLRGREVFVAYDCDDAGREGSAKLAAALRKAGATARILDLTKLGLPYTETRGADLWPGRLQGGYGDGKSAVDWSRPFNVASVYRYYFKPTLAKLGFRAARWHDLRHFYASACAAQGIDIRKVSRWIGHANINTTDSIYTHLFNGSATEDIDRLDSLASRPAPASIPRID
ncbi:MAG: hypothetical protein DI534_10460 [Leifsonia xyli]|nr:MAG: hypothetical protein DI534_10460 [Leifsonia xyli]